MLNVQCTCITILEKWKFRLVNYTIRSIILHISRDLNLIDEKGFA